MWYQISVMHDQSWQHNNGNISFRRRHQRTSSSAKSRSGHQSSYRWIYLIIIFLKNAPDKWSVERFFRHNSRLLSVCVSVTLLYSAINLSLTWSFTRGSLHLQTLVYHAKSGSPRNSTNFIHVHFHFPSGYFQSLTGSQCRAGCGAPWGCLARTHATAISPQTCSIVLAGAY